MIRTRAARFFTLRFSVVLLLSLLPASALAQLPTVPPDVKRANEVSASKGQIEQFISAAVTQLSAEGTEDQKTAREALVREATVGGQPASAAYLSLYTQLLNGQLLTLAKSPTTRPRLNGAIVTYSVAKIANDASLAPAATAFLNDNAPAVVLWAVKSGRFLVPAQLRAFGGNSKLPAAIVAAAKAHPKGPIGGAIAAEAYDALTLDISQARNLQPAMIQAVIPPVLDMLSFRVGEFRKGVPAEPSADLTGAGFLVHPTVWPLQNPQQQAMTVQVLSDLVSLAAEQALKANPTDQRFLLTIVIPRLAKSLSVAGSNSGEAGMVQVITPVAEPQRGLNAKQMSDLVKSVYPSIQKSAKYGKTNAPPAVTGNEAAPAPASAPTTGPVVIPGIGPAVAAPPGAATRPAGPVAPKPGGAAPAPAPAPRPTTPTPRPAPRPPSGGTAPGK